MNNITFTASPMTKPVDMPLKASLAWDYFFNNGSWFCVETGDGGIIVTDETRYLNEAFVLPDYSSLLEWLESYSADHLAEDPADYLRACGVVPDNLLSDSVVQALLATINAPESPDAPPVSAEKKPEPPSQASPGGSCRAATDEGIPDEADEQGYYVTFQVDGRYTVRVDASDLESAKYEAELDFEEADFGGLETEDSRIIYVEDEVGHCLYEY